MPISHVTHSLGAERLRLLGSPRLERVDGVSHGQTFTTTTPVPPSRSTPPPSVKRGREEEDDADQQPPPSSQPVPRLLPALAGQPRTHSAWLMPAGRWDPDLHLFSFYFTLVLRGELAEWLVSSILEEEREVIGLFGNNALYIIYLPRSSTGLIICWS